MRQITLKYRGRCCLCGAPLEAGTVARWHGRGRISCVLCPIEHRIEQRRLWIEAVTRGGRYSARQAAEAWDKGWSRPY